MSAKNGQRGRTLVPCSVCGGTHFAGSQRERRCLTAGRRGQHAPAVVAPHTSDRAVASGEFTFTGDGDEMSGLPIAHTVFSAQMLPRGVPADPQPAHEMVPAAMKNSRKIISLHRAAARSAVREWRRRGIEPTQRMMTGMDTYVSEAEELLSEHLALSQEKAQRMKAQGLTLPPQSLSVDYARKHCFHAVQTLKGLAVSPTSVYRLIARAAPHSPYDARTLTSFGVGLRAVADSNPAVRHFLSIDRNRLEAQHVEPIAAMLKNVGARQEGRVRYTDDGHLISEVTAETLTSFSPDAVADLEGALRLIEDEARARGWEGEPLSIFGDHSDLLAIPPQVAGDLLANGLSWRQWRENGWAFPDYEREPLLVILDPRIVKQRIEGLSDEMLVALNPQLTSHSDNEYSPQKFLSGPGYYAVGGFSSRGGEKFGSETYTREGERISRLFAERNLRQHQGFAA